MDQALRRAVARLLGAACGQVRKLPQPYWAYGLLVLIFFPVLWGAYALLAPVARLSVWWALWQDAQSLQALGVTLVSSVLSTLLACALAALFASGFYPGARWARFQRHLPLLLSVPHAAFAVGFFFLFAPSGWIARGLALWMQWPNPPDWASVQDAYGLSLALALAVKESWFLLWMMAALLGEQAIATQMLMGRTLGYNKRQVWRLILWPQLWPRLVWPVIAVFAYGLSVVDMAMILGPSTPPSLAVLAWEWLRSADPALQARGQAASIALVLILLCCVAGVSLLVYGFKRFRAYPSGRRQPGPGRRGLPLDAMLGGLGYGVVLVLLLWSVAETWFFPAIWPSALTLSFWQQANLAPFWTTLWLASASSLLCLPVVLIVLEWAPARLRRLLYLPLILPVLPLAAGQYGSLVKMNLDGSVLGLIWSHLPWVFPYMLLTLTGPYQAFDARLLFSARALGCSPWQACWRVKWPVLLRPILIAWSVGFAVSVAQYLPTIFAGAGRFATVTTEAVALSAGGSRAVLAVQSLLQVALPLAAFGAAMLLAHWHGRGRKGLQ